MHVAVLIAGTPGRLERSLVESLRNAWGGGVARWLAPGEAAEFDLGVMPGNRWEVWAEMRTLGIDIAVVPAAGRRKQVLLADMDSTMIGQECIDELADVAGVGDRVKDITARAMNGELDFEGALRERVAMLAGLSEEVIEHVLATRITAAPGGRVLVATMKSNGAHAALVSGGFTAFTGPVAARIGFDSHRANLLLAEGGRLTGRVAEPILGREAKVTALHELSAALGITPDEAVAVGDGANDLGMLGAAGLGVALHAKPSVAAQCEPRSACWSGRAAWTARSGTSRR
jgi:phosphoserine phosphatase